MDASQEPDRPESLPQQVTRIATSIGQRAYATRARWTPWALLGVCLGFQLASRLQWPSLSAASDYWTRLAWLFAGSAATTTPVVLSGLATSFYAAGVARRWIVGGATIAATIAVHAIELEGWDQGALASERVQQWLCWVAIGFVAKIAWGLSFGLHPDESAKQRLQVADLLLLTTFAAIALGLQAAALDALQHDSSVSVAPVSAAGTLVWYLVGIGISTIPYFPVLWGVLSTSRQAPSRLPLGAFASILLLMIADAAIGLVYYPQWFDAWVYLWSFGATRIGEVAGIAAAVLTLRWAGYRLRSTQ